MSLLAMPIAVANLGAEMVYILEQRLKAQEIPEDKAAKVLTDVVTSMFNKAFCEEIFHPQEVLDIGATRQVFDRLAHSSIMRLSTSSMDKLYDLMLMSFKYQILCSRRPKDIFEVTMLHLTSLKRIVPDKGVQGCVDDVMQKMQAVYAGFGEFQWLDLRQALMRFLKDKRVKVSLFLHEGIQVQDGRILLPLPLPENPNDPQPGTMQILGSSAGNVLDTRVIHLGSLEVDTADFHCHPHPLGANLYDKSRTPFTPPRWSSLGSDGQQGQCKAVRASLREEINSPKAVPKAATPHYKTLGTAEEVFASGIGSGGKDELNALARMIALRKPEEDNFKLNLFPEDDKELPSTVDVSTFEPVVRTIELGDSTSRASRRELDQLVADLDVGGSGDAAGGGDDDLLDLMDKAS
uniref:Protein oscp1 isoform x1 n=1 Tax=Tetraselmis sp. GSL018 TaxID=582737 RepID=A0A061R0Q1_9CHLO|mmetsp:Transcript_13017/g.30873  ORF Transcript_13017/g.30873 Transcript_13017/m.30873 type:complete len:407 (-) Transcript_13017:199-1419(-)